MSKIVSGLRRCAVVAVAVVYWRCCAPSPLEVTIPWRRSAGTGMSSRFSKRAVSPVILSEGPALPALANVRGEDAKTHRVSHQGRDPQPKNARVVGRAWIRRVPWRRLLVPDADLFVASWVEAGAPAPVGTGAPLLARESGEAWSRTASARGERRRAAVESPDGSQRDQATIPGAGRIRSTGSRSSQAIQRSVCYGCGSFGGAGSGAYRDLTESRFQMGPESCSRVRSS